MLHVKRDGESSTWITPIDGNPHMIASLKTAIAWNIAAMRQLEVADTLW